MNRRVALTVKQVALFAATSLIMQGVIASRSGATEPQASSSTAQSPERIMGTIKSISGNNIILATDNGKDVTVVLLDTAKLVRVAPGQTDLKNAAPISLAELQTGDRILVRGSVVDAGKSIQATFVVAMRKADIADKQSREREEWQRHGTGGLVVIVDAAAGTIAISLPAIGEKKSLSIHLTKDTILRRYAPDSVKFDDARPAPLDQIKPGDQLRARGARSADGSELSAVEIVSGTFRNIAGTITAVDVSRSTLTVQDLALKKSATLKITGDSQLRKLPLPMAQRIAARLKGIAAETSAVASASTGGAQPPRAGGALSGFGGRPGGGGPPDLQQAVARMPAATLADLQKGDALMIVATQSGPDGLPTVISLLAGVEPILEASPQSTASTILSPWSLSAAPSGEAATP